MAIKVFGDKIVFPDNTEQDNCLQHSVELQHDVYTRRAEIDEQQEAQDDQDPR